MKKILIVITLITFFAIQNILVKAEWQNVKFSNSSQIVSANAIMPDGKILILSDARSAGNQFMISDVNVENWETFLAENDVTYHYFFNADNPNNILYCALDPKVHPAFALYSLNYFSKETKMIRANDVAHYLMYRYFVNGDEIIAVGEMSLLSIAPMWLSFPTISKTNDNGISWWDTAFTDYVYYENVDVMYGEGITSISVLNDSTYILLLISPQSIASPTGRVLKSTDSGKTWAETLFEKDVRMQNMKFFGDKVGIIYGGSGTLYKTEDGGESWFNLYPLANFEDTTYWFVDIYFFDTDKILSVGSHVSRIEAVICYSEDGGLTWATQHRLSGTSLLSIAVDHDKIYCFGRNGMLVKGNVSDLSSISKPSQILSLQLCPNPTSESTNIFLELETACNVKIVLCDLLGQELLQVYDDFAVAGLFTSTIQTNNLARGIYFLKVLIDGNIVVERVIVE